MVSLVVEGVEGIRYNKSAAGKGIALIVTGVNGIGNEPVRLVVDIGLKEAAKLSAEIAKCLYDATQDLSE